MNYHKIVRASAVYDLIVTTPFMFPPIAKQVVVLTQDIAGYFGLDTAINLTPDAFIWMSLMATVVVMWSILRAITPETRFGLYDGLNRLAFSFWFLFYPLFYGTSELSYLFLGPELVWAIVQLWGYRQQKMPKHA